MKILTKDPLQTKNSLGIPGVGLYPVSTIDSFAWIPERPGRPCLTILFPPVCLNNQEGYLQGLLVFLWQLSIDPCFQ